MRLLSLTREKEAFYRFTNPLGRTFVNILHQFQESWKSHATLTLLAKQDLAPFGYNMIDPFGQNSIDHLAQLLL